MRLWPRAAVWVGIFRHFFPETDVGLILRCTNVRMPAKKKKSQRGNCTSFMASCMQWQLWKYQIVEAIGRRKIAFFPPPVFGERFHTGHQRLENILSYLFYDEKPGNLDHDSDDACVGGDELESDDWWPVRWFTEACNQTWVDSRSLWMRVYSLKIWTAMEVC